MALVQTFQTATQPKTSKDEQVAKHFRGARARWRGTYDTLVETVSTFGPGVAVSTTDSYISILRRGKKFAIAQVTAERMDIGIKRKGAEPDPRFEAAGSWNSMVTHRVRISDPHQLDAEVFAWLRQAYDLA